jgi:hypothetical protein
MLARNRGFERYVANTKPLISFTHVGCDAPDRKYKLHVYSHICCIYCISFCLNNFTLVEGRKFAFQTFTSPPILPPGAAESNLRE